MAERGIRDMEERLSREILDRWRQWTVCGGRVEPLTEGQGTIGHARRRFWREVLGDVWWVGEGMVGEAVADDALRTGMAGRAIGPGYD